jgi:hypothetical protein
MATPLAFTATYSHSADAVRAAIASEQYWKDRLAEVGGPGARLESFELAGDVLTIRMVQTIPSSELPSSITSVRPGDMIIPRTEVYTAGSDTGTFAAHVDGAPAEVEGTVTLAESGSGTTATAAGSVRVAVPLFGKKIEAAVAEKLLELLASEAAFTDTWISQH